MKNVLFVVMDVIGFYENVFVEKHSCQRAIMHSFVLENAATNAKKVVEKRVNIIHIFKEQK